MVVKLFPMKVAQTCLLAVLCVYVHFHILNNCQRDFKEIWYLGFHYNVSPVLVKVSQK